MYGISRSVCHRQVRCNAYPDGVSQKAVRCVEKGERLLSKTATTEIASRTWTALTGVNATTMMKPSYVYYGKRVMPYPEFQQRVEDDWPEASAPSPTHIPPDVVIDSEANTRSILLIRVFAQAAAIVSDILGVEVEWSDGIPGKGGRLIPDLRCIILSDRTVFALAELKSSPVLPDLGSANFFDFVKQLQSFAREEIIKRLKPGQEEYQKWATYSQASTYAVEFMTPHVIISTGASTVFLKYQFESGTDGSAGSSQELVVKASGPILCDSVKPTLLQAVITFTLMAYNDHVNNVKLVAEVPIEAVVDKIKDEFTGDMKPFANAVFIADEVLTGTVLGNGSYGCVREGVFCQQSVAVKSAQVSPDCSWEDVCAALANEAHVLQHLKGVSVVPTLLAVGCLLHAASWSPSIIMTRVLGQRLDDLLSPGHSLSVADRIWLHKAVLDGVAELHSRGVIHGDWVARHILVDVTTHRLFFIDFGEGSIGADAAQLREDLEAVVILLDNLGLKPNVDVERSQDTYMMYPKLGFT